MEYLWEYLSTMHWGAVAQIVLIDILLGGDNAVIIGLACRNLPKEQRRKGIFWGTFGAIILRILLLTVAISLLEIPYLKFIGGILLFWIGVKLLTQDNDAHGDIKAGDKLWTAVKTILIADFVMSVDNVIAVAAAAQKADPDHQMGLLIFGVILSIPIIIWGSQLVLKYLEKYPVIVTLGAALLGWIAASLIVKDVGLSPHLLAMGFDAQSILFSFDMTWLKDLVNGIYPMMETAAIHIRNIHIAECVGALLVVLVGYILKKRRG